jgi:hypothetical protein
MAARYSRAWSAHRWALITAVCMLVATTRFTHALPAANNMPPQQDIFARSHAYERFIGAQA